MLTVPSPATASVAPIASTGIGYQTAAGATPDAFGASIGTAEQGLGKQLEATGDMLATHALKMQDDLNVAHSEDLFLKGSTELGQLQEKYKSLEGANRVNALPQFMDDAAAIREKYRNQAPNDDVNKKFDQLFTRQLGYSVREAGSLAGQATRQYMRDTSSAVQANSLSEIAKNSDDDKQFLANTSTGLESMRAQPDYTGASPEVQKNKDETFVSSAWATRLQSLAVDNPIRARDLLNKNKDSLDGITQLKLEPLINQAIINKDVPVRSDAIIQQVGSGSMEDRLKKLEGYSEKPYADFKQTSSGYGTKAQPGDENIPPEQRQAVYTQRLRNELSSAYQIVDNFAPGLAKGARDALADLTYNTGSAWTSSGLGQAIHAGDMEKAKSILPQYNQAGGEVNPALVKRRAEELTWWNNDTGPALSDPAAMLSKSLDLAKEAGAKVFPNDSVNQAKYIDTLQSRLSSDLGLMQRSARDMQLQTQNNIYKEIYADPNNPITSLDKLSPQAQALYTAAPYGLQKNIDAAIKRAATQDVPLTAERQARFDTLRGESINEPDKFMSRNIAEQDLPRPQQSILLKAQADRKALVDKGTKLNASMQAVQPLLNDAGITQSKTDKSKQDEYNKFSGVFDQQLQNFTQKNQRPPNDKETREIGQGLLKDIVTSKGWFGDNTSKAYQVVADKTPITLNVDDPNSHFATLPRGATFIGPDGKPRVKQ